MLHRTKIGILTFYESIKDEENDILEETEELIKIFVTSIKTAEKKPK